MSRAEYTENVDVENWDFIRWRGAVTSSLRGLRGQAFLRELIAALDAMPEKRLITDSMKADGAFCALGSVAQARGMTDVEKYNALEADSVGPVFGISSALAREIMYINDEAGYHKETAEERWIRVRTWAERSLIEWET